MEINSYLSPKLGVRQHPDPVGPGLYATQPIQQGELLVVWSGVIVNYERLQQLPKQKQRHSVQVEEAAYLVSIQEEPVDYVNHSCDPNAGISGQIAVIAMRSIEPGEDVCIDYAMCDGSPYDEFECGCGSKLCRGQISGQDWMNPDLWERYDGYFSAYLQRRIDRLKMPLLQPEYLQTAVNVQG